MDSFVRLFIKSSLAWLAGGVSLGVAMAVVRARPLPMREAVSYETHTVAGRG